jgi:hypothetical protein
VNPAHVVRTVPAFLERLEPGAGFTLTLSVKSFDKTTERTFRFEAR